MPGVYVALGASRARVPLDVSKSGRPTPPRGASKRRPLFLVIVILRFFHHHGAKILQIGFNLDPFHLLARCGPNPNIVEREDGGVDYSMGISTVYGSPSQIKASR